jgi:integrase
MTLRTFAVEKWEPVVLPTVKYSTRKHYGYALNNHLLPAFGDAQLRHIDRETVQNLLGAKLKQGLAWKTVKHLRTVLGTVLGAAEAWEYIESNPVRKTRMPRRGPEPEGAAVSPDQIQGLLASLPEPSHSLAWLLVLTGLRIGELLALRWRDVDLNAGLLHVRRTVYEGHFDEPKSKRSRRTVPLTPKAVEILSTRKRDGVLPDALVFSSGAGTPLDRHNLFNRQLQPASEKLKLERVGWHWLRHAHATLLDAVGTPLGTVQALLGHSSPEITREIYLHSIPADARNAVEKVEQLLNGPKRTQIVQIPKLGSQLIQ